MEAIRMIDHKWSYNDNLSARQSWGVPGLRPPHVEDHICGRSEAWQRGKIKQATTRRSIRRVVFVGRFPEQPWSKRYRYRMPSDRKSTRLNSSHGYISYAVFCLKKKKNEAKHKETHI